MTTSYPRIISLLPSATEIVCKLGLRKKLVGRSHECDFPANVKNLTVCSRPNYSFDGDSQDINRSVESVLEQTLSIYRVDIESIRELQPTHIITQSQCSVCAISTEELKQILGDVLREQEITIIDSTPMSLNGIFQNIQEIAACLGRPEEGDAFVQQMKVRFESINEQTRPIEQTPTIAHIEWIEPLMTGGHWVMSMIEWAGGKNLFPDEDHRWISFDELKKADPDKIVIAPCGFSIARTIQEMDALTKKPGWSSLKSVQNGQVFLCDGSSYFNRPGPRLADSVEILGQIYHPETFANTYRPDDWRVFQPADGDTDSTDSAHTTVTAATGDSTDTNDSTVKKQ